MKYEDGLKGDEGQVERKAHFYVPMEKTHRLSDDTLRKIVEQVCLICSIISWKYINFLDCFSGEIYIS